MIDPTGHVTVNERMPSQRFHRFVDEKLKLWMREHAIYEGAREHATEPVKGEAPAEYEVAFFDEDSLGQVSCLVVIYVGDRLYRSWESADSPQMALTRSLENLKVEDESPTDLSEVRH